jgi:type IV pilus assembly protein PilY1
MIRHFGLAVWLTVLGFSTPATAVAAPLSLAQSPPGTAREPAPNIIVSVDDSGSMGVTGMATLKAALTQTFNEANVTDGRVRLGWNSMNTCRTISTDGSTPANCGSFNGIHSLGGAHRSNFLNWVTNDLPATPPGSNLTPSHQMMQRAGEYFRTTGQYSPFRTNPGSTTDATELSCRKAFNIFMTDGAWNTFQQSPYLDGNGISVGGGNADGIAKTFPDGVVYNPASPQTRMYQDAWGNNGLSTLSDVAFHYWSTDLQPALTNNVFARNAVATPETIGGTTLDPYWNPKNNPANWQSMSTYTIGFTPSATNWTGNPTFSATAGMYGGSGYEALVSGAQTWVSPLCSANGGNPDTVGGNVACDLATGKYGARNNYRSSELWHMALNSRGRFVPAPNAGALVSAFQTILDDILIQTENPLVSIASSSTRLRADGFVYIAGFNSERWSGQLGAYTIAAGTNAVAPTPIWTATASMDAAGFSVPNRVVVSSVNGTTGTSFVWANLSAGQQSQLQGSDNATVGQQRVSYLRGDRALEGSVMRQRSSRLGDIVNSNIWRTAKPLRMSFEHAGHLAFRNLLSERPSVLYVGANDGMLHAFRASDGQELMAYVPLGVYDKLRSYTLPTYAHKYFVDGHSFTGDADVSGSGTGNSATPDWKTVLVSGLGAGGRGYFLLDVTVPTGTLPPATTPTATLTSTFTTTGVIVDRTFPASGTASFAGFEDVGHIFALPVVDPVTGNRTEQIIKLNNGRWAVMMGNGMNSINERPVLLIQYLDGNRELFTIVANSTTGQSNGLSAPRLVDVNGDGKMDLVYAGDQRGNLWKFNISSTSASNWGVSNWSGGAPCSNSASCTPFYVAQDGASALQPISAAPIWMPHPMGGIQVLFGTGRNMTEADRASTATQSIYSVWDLSNYTVSTSTTATVSVADTNNITNGRSALVQQTLISTVTSTTGSVTTDTDFFNTSSNAVAYSRATPTINRGWYLDLPESRERVLNHPQIFEGQKVIVGSNIPKLGATGETCNLSVQTEDNYINVFNMITGRPAQTPVFVSSDSSMNLAGATRTRFGSGEYIGINKSSGGLDLVSFKNDDPTCPVGQLCTEGRTLTTGNVPGARADWREIR